MQMRFGLRWQMILVVVLFAASLVVLLSSTLVAIQLPAREQELRLLLIEASRRMAEEAVFLLEKPLHFRQDPPPLWRPQLTDIANRVLEGSHGVEGGFYLDPWHKFIGHAFPTNPYRTPESPLGSALSDDPPPNEKSPIHDQCVNSLNLDGPNVRISEIGPSRVMIVTEPVGRERPARMATWVMTRLTSPEHTATELTRFRVSTALAMAGILAALVLTANLGRNLRRERHQREQLREELRRAEHLAALGRLLAGVAHEVRNPLAAIRSTAQLYQRLPSRDPSMLDPILQSVDRLNALVSRLLFFVRSGHEQRRPIDVNAIVQETLALLRAQADSQQVVLQTELASDLPPLLGSAPALQQVVLNLASNALQAMPNGGTLRCGTRCLSGPPRIELWIADTGPGIAAEELPHLFEPFHTTRPEGTGLGLALCREIVQQHGGEIELDRQPGWGAVFRVTLPVADSAPS